MRTRDLCRWGKRGPGAGPSTPLFAAAQRNELTAVVPMSPKNCWDHKSCGRQPGGQKVAELGVCPVTTATSANGMNRGRNAGRACWVVSGSLCGGKVQGTFATKLGNCMACDFYKTVKAEEGSAYVNSTALLKVLAT